MKKKSIQYNQPKTSQLGQLLQEPETAYAAAAKGFNHKHFQQLSNLLGFTVAEWAAILHISDRTLQRYLKAGKPFTGLHSEMLVHIKALTDIGLELFESPSSFVAWLRQPKVVLGQELGFSSLQSMSGIRLLHQELGRIAHGVYI